ncbi:hypothetical protein PG997_013232 [Apiospora hydei]|uniref:Uncharacterized protein n=1 Tax=Apiospora hydei TaxID=1337664 RepID=A0ABR1V888_9PEZI
MRPVRAGDLEALTRDYDVVPPGFLGVDALGLEVSHQPQIVTHTSCFLERVWRHQLLGPGIQTEPDCGVGAEAELVEDFEALIQ